MNKTSVRQARSKVTEAIKRGRLVRAPVCEKCCNPGPVAIDGRATIQAHHHKGYEFPLDVIWLCPACHAQVDKRASKEANGMAKLTREIVAIIRAKHKGSVGGRHIPSPTSFRSLAKEFGVCSGIISRIVNNQSWVEERDETPKEDINRGPIY